MGPHVRGDDSLRNFVMRWVAIDQPSSPRLRGRDDVLRKFRYMRRSLSSVMGRSRTRTPVA
jgi:hypothetical protein